MSSPFSSRELWPRLGLALVVLGLVLASACGGRATSDATVCRGCAGSGNAGGSLSQGEGGARSVPKFDAFGCQGLPASEKPTDACAGVSFECEAGPTRTYFLIERSAKMAEAWGTSSRYQIVRDAALEFGKSRPLGTVQFFGLPANDPRDRCDPDSYSEPLSVGLGAEQVGRAFGQSEPALGNPLFPAMVSLLGSIQRQLDEDAFFAQLVVLLASAPDECGASGTLDEVLHSVRDAKLRTQGLQIAVIQLGDSVDATPLAQAAGTLPFRIQADGASERLLSAIRQSVDSCYGVPRFECNTSWEVPRAPEFDEGRVEINIRLDIGPPESVPFLSGAAACDSSPNGGFFLDSSTTPALIHTCPCSCARLSWGSVEILSFCPAAP